MQFNKDNITYTFSYCTYSKCNNVTIKFSNDLCEFDLYLSCKDDFINTFNDIIPKMEKLEEFEIQHTVDVMAITFQLIDNKFYISTSNGTWYCNRLDIKLICDIKDMIEIFKDIIDKYNNKDE
jgi:Sec7-like guanine-nucleotide exchange factor